MHACPQPLSANQRYGSVACNLLPVGDFDFSVTHTTRISNRKLTEACQLKVNQKICLFSNIAGHFTEKVNKTNIALKKNQNYCLVEMV